jgi:hypothetical protein
MPFAFSIPPYPDLFSVTPNQMPILFVPNIKFIQKFLDGDLGIATKLESTAYMLILQSIPSIVAEIKPKSFGEKDAEKVFVKAQRDVLDMFLKISKAEIGDNIDQYFTDGIFKPPSSIGFKGIPGNLGGFKSLEKAMVQSIFETKKPEITIIKLVIERFVEIEDIIAVILGVVSPSLKPSANPRALGYQGPQDGGGVQKGISDLEQFAKKKGPKNKLSDNLITADNIPSKQFPNSEPNYATGTIKITQSIAYSTGDFDEKTQYTYFYNDIFEEPFGLSPGTVSTAIDDDSDDDKEETIIVGIYDGDWNPVTQQDIEEFIPWVKKKYILGSEWPQIRETQDYDYIYEGFATVAGVSIKVYNEWIGTADRPTQWGVGDLAVPISWKIKRYNDEGPSVDVNGEVTYFKNGFPMIAYNNDKINSTLNYFKNYYIEYSDKKISEAMGSNPGTIEDDNGVEMDAREYSKKRFNQMFSDFSSGGMLSTDFEGLLENGFYYLSRNNTDGLQNVDKFSRISFPLKPVKIGDTWYSLEKDYDMKILKCDSSINITYAETVDTPQKNAVIKRFIRKATEISLPESQSFGYFLKKDNGDTLVVTDQTSLKVDWLLGDAPYKFKIIELEDFAEELNTFTVGTDSDLPIEVIDTKIPQEFLDGATIIPTSTDTEAKDKWYFVPFNDSYKLSKDEFRREYVQSSGFKANSGTWSYDVKYGSAELTTAQILVTSTDIPDNIKNLTGGTVKLLQFKFLNKIAFMIGDNSVDSKGFLKNKYTFFCIYNGKPFANFIPNNNEISILRYDLNDNSVTLISTQNPPNLIRVEDFSTGTAKPRIISKVNVTNPQLQTDKPIGNTPYGTPNPNTGTNENTRQTVEQFFRYQRTIDDVKTFYIVEATLKSKNNRALLSEAENQEVEKKGGSRGKRIPGFGLYTRPSIFLVVPKFIKMLIKIFAKLFPVIQQFLTLITNPMKFLTDIIIAKLGDDFGAEVPKFGFYSKEFMAQLKQLTEFLQRMKDVKNQPLDVREEVFDQMEAFLKNSLLEKYVYVPKSGDAIFIFDGAAVLKLFGDAPILQGLPTLTFGIESNLGSLLTPNPKIPFKLIFDFSGFRRKGFKAVNDIKGENADLYSDQILNSSIFNSKFDPSLSVKNQIVTQAGGQTHVQEVSVVYSTGVFREDYQYTYTEVTEEVLDLIAKASQLESAGDDESLTRAQRLLEEASRKDPNNEFIKEKIKNIQKLKKIKTSHPLFDFILNIVALPLKVVIGIIKFILKFFKDLVNPFALPTTIVNFLSFKWILDFFSPISKNSMFAMAGLLFDLETLFTVWLPSMSLGIKFEFDLNDIIKLPWATLPTYTLEQFKDLVLGMGLSGPRKFKFPFFGLITMILCLIESVINSVIDFIWSLLGLLDPESGRWIILPPPYLKLCRSTNNQLTVKDMVDILTGNFVPPKASEDGARSGTASNPVTPSYNFVYDITTSDGRNLSELNQTQLDQFVEENKDLEFNFNF